MKKPALKRFRVKTTSSKETGILKISRKTGHTFREAQTNHLSFFFQIVGLKQKSITGRFLK